MKTKIVNVLMFLFFNIFCILLNEYLKILYNSFSVVSIIFYIICLFI